MFTSLLIQRCTISRKLLATEGYEAHITWSPVYSDVPTRMDSDNTPRISDSGLRLNTDDFLFFFDPNTDIKRGNRITLDGENYGVLKVNKCLGRGGVHHLEVVARMEDHQ